MTWGILLLCGLVYLWQAILPPGVEERFVMTWGMVPYRLTYRPDLLGFVTILTSMFMHGGLLHIAGNLWFLRIFGDNVEDNMGPVRFAVFYLLCGIVAAISQVAINPSSTIPMVGASGAIAGVLAAYLVLFPRARVLTLIPIFVFIQWAEIPAFVFIAVWFIYQFFAGVGSLSHGGGGVAFWAHIGGFIAGLVLVFLFRRPTEAPPRVAVRRPPGSTPWHDDARW